MLSLGGPKKKTLNLNTFLKDQQRFHRCQTLGFKNGLSIQKKPFQGIGGERLIQDLILSGQENDQRNKRQDEEM